MEDKDASASHEPVQTAQVDMVVDGQTSEIVPDKLFVMFGVVLIRDFCKKIFQKTDKRIL